MHLANIHKATRLASQDQLAIFFLFSIFLLFLPISSFFLLFHSFFLFFLPPCPPFHFCPGPPGPFCTPPRPPPWGPRGSRSQAGLSYPSCGPIFTIIIQLQSLLTYCWINHEINKSWKWSFFMQISTEEWLAPTTGLQYYLWSTRENSWRLSLDACLNSVRPSVGR